MAYACGDSAHAAPAPKVCPTPFSAEEAPAYTCLNDTAGVPTWTFVAPSADLFEGKELAGAHYVGPTWEALDGSTVVADSRRLTRPVETSGARR
ncbi:MAG TPA: DUF3455 domain-containing protein [Polyangiales bacterium]|nr:DUF3455 domain-containing protein [Polyangiales bacterium]